MLCVVMHSWKTLAEHQKRPFRVCRVQNRPTEHQKRPFRVCDFASVETKIFVEPKRITIFAADW